MSTFITVSVLDMIDDFGEELTQNILSEFSCEKNKEIETFVHKDAIEFARKKMSITYLVFNEEANLAGIFTLTHKAIEISSEGLSNTAKKKMERFAHLDDNEYYALSAFLIAQFGKNSAYTGPRLEGSYLMQLALEVLFDAQRKIGGGVVYLECEDKLSLLNFYQSKKNGFTAFNERFSVSDNVKYIQLFKLIC